MDQVTLVDRQIEDGQKLVEQLVQTGFPVTVAFWLKTSEDSQWYLYIASPVVEEEGPAKAYRRAHTMIRQMPQPFWIDPFEVKLIEPSDPIAEDALALHHRYAARGPIRYGGNQLGGVSIDGAFLYPVPISVGTQ